MVVEHPPDHQVLLDLLVPLVLPDHRPREALAHQREDLLDHPDLLGRRDHQKACHRVH